jgi:hypothetical protein
MLRPASRGRLPAALLAACALATATAWTVTVRAQPAVRSAAAPAIAGLEVNADAGLAPGSTLEITVRGTAGASARVQVPGTAIDLRLPEGAPGVYTTQYTVRRTDRFDAGSLLRASLSSGERVAIGNFSFPPSFSAAQSVPVAVPPPTGAQAGGAGAVAEPGAAVANPGNDTSRAGAAARGPLTLDVASPAANAAVGAGPVVVQGRTAPGARVQLRVDAVPPAAAGRLSVAQTVTQQTLVADAEGNFRASFEPPRVVPGTRFELVLSASDGQQATPAQKFLLFQRQG